jgi:hypothetical protein
MNQPSDGARRVRRQPRKWQVARRQHLRQQQHGDGLDGRHGEQEHHHRAVHREQLVVGFLRHDARQWRGQLHAHDQRQDACGDEEAERGGDEQEADEVVVDGAEAPPAGRRLPDLLQRLELARRPAALRREARIEAGVEAGLGRRGRGITHGAFHARGGCAGHCSDSMYAASAFSSSAFSER